MRPMGIHHLLTYNISIQYVLVIHVHVTYRVCTSEVKTDEETKNHPLPLLRRNSNIKRCILCIWNAFSLKTHIRYLIEVKAGKGTASTALKALEQGKANKLLYLKGDTKGGTVGNVQTLPIYLLEQYHF